MRWLVRAVASLVLLAVLAVAALFLVPTQTVARLASAQIEKITGRVVTLDGSVRPTVWPQLGVRTGAVTLANADWSDEGPMLTAQSLSISVDMAALIGGTVRVTGIDLVSPRLRLERAADGRVNWDFSARPDSAGALAGSAGDATAGQGSRPAATPFTIDSARIENGHVTYVDRVADSRHELDAIDLLLAVPDFQGRADLSGSAMLSGQRLTLSGSIDNFAAALDGKVIPARITGGIGGSSAGFDGRLGLSPFAGEGALDATLDDLPAVFAVLGQTVPDLPEGLGHRSISAKGALTLTSDGGIYLREGTIGLDGNSLRGAFDLVPGKNRPKLTARIATGALDLPGTADKATKGGGATAAPKSRRWSTARIDASGLGAIDADVALSADSITLGTLALGKTRLGVVLDAARAVIDLREVAAYGGTLSGQVVVNARKGLSARADVAMAGLALQPVLSDAAGYDRLSGTGDVRVNLLASGSSMDALMQSLSGEGNLAFRNGELRGLDLAGMLRNLDPNYVGEGAKTVFDGITATFSAQGGQLTTADLSLLAPVLTASGAGAVDVGGQSLDLRLIPLTLGGNALDPDVQVPLRISGPWAKPNFSLDLNALADRKIEEERKKLEQKAKDALAKRIEDETGVVAQDGESLEDTARRAAEQALQDKAEGALKDLLGIPD